MILVRVAPPPTPEKIGELTRSLREHSGRHDRIGILVSYDFSHFSGPLPDQATRDQLFGTVREAAPRVFGAALVVDRAGFLGATVRSVVTGIVLVKKPEFDLKIFAAGPEACAWLSTRGPGVDADGLRAELERISAVQVS